MGLFNTSYNLVRLYAENKKRQLQNEGTPQTKVDSGGSDRRTSWSEQKHERSKLREVKQIRDSGGIVARMMRWKSLIFFGTGVEINSQNDDLKEWIHNEAFPRLDSRLIELGEDALWFPYALGEIVETRGGGFSHFEAVEPWTVIPVEDEHGQVIRWEQQIKGDYGSTEEVYDADELVSFIVNKSSARDNTGISEVVRAEKTITQWMENRDAAQNAIDQAGYRRLIAKVGNDQSIIDDNELRRVRNRLDNLDEDTVLVTGPDMEFKLLDAMDPSSFKEMREMDMRDLALALGVPIEFASVISEGLGSGEQSGFRERAFILEAKAAQKLLAGQFTENVLRPVIEEYSPYPADDLRGITFGDPMPEEPSITDQAPYLTLNETREKLDMPPEEDEELGDSYRKPANIQAPEEEEPEDGGGIGGLFGNKTQLQDVEDIDTGDYPEAAQENARMALEAREETGNPNDCGTRVGWERANQLDNGEDLSEETISRMAQFERHEDNYDPDAEREDCGWLMWKAWGGTEGIEWAQDKLDEFEEARANAEGEEGNEQLAELEAWLDDVHENFVCADETSKTLTEFSQGQIPEMVETRMKEAIRSGAVFSQFDQLPSSELMDLRQRLQDMLTDDNWSLDNMAGELSDRFDVSEDKAETWARTETQSIVNHAAEDAYNELEEERGEEFRYKWVGSVDDRTTEACVWLLEQTNPNYGGEPVTMERLKELIQEAPEHDPDINTEPRTFTPHINCRKRYTRVVE